MRAERFRAEITANSRGHAVITIPFDPDEAWGAKAVHHVSGTVNGCRVRVTIAPGDSGWAFTLNPARMRHMGIAAVCDVIVELAPEGPQRADLADFLTHPTLQILLDTAFDTYDRRRQTGNGSALAIVGHSRLATNGSQSNYDNNQPVITRGAVALHNGIVVNDRSLEARHPRLVLRGELDSEVLAGLLRAHLDDTKDLIAATRETFAEIEGSASIAMLFDDLEAMLLATNTGSLFQLAGENGHVLAFASERFILHRLLEDRRLGRWLGRCRIEQ